MKGLVKMRRDNVAFNISQNPTDITLHCEEKVQEGGGFKKVEHDYPMTVRIFFTGDPSAQIVSETAGLKQSATYYGMLADYQAEFSVDADAVQTFDANGMHFKVTSVTPTVMKGEIVGYQCELERVS